VIDKKRILKYKSKLKGKKIYINLDLHPDDQAKERSLRAQFKVMKDKDKELKMGIRNNEMRIYKGGKLVDTITLDEEMDGEEGDPAQ